MAAAVEEILQGASLRECADLHSISHATVRRWLISDVPERYREIQREGLLARIVEADMELDDAEGHVGISRAREKCRFTRWDAERRLPRMFAPRQEISGPGGGPIALQLDNLERARRGAFIQALMESAQEAEIIVEPLKELLPEAPSPSKHARYEATKQIEAERKEMGL